MDITFVENAYRKLKGSVYWDKTLPFIRNRIVEFESHKNYHYTLTMISKAFSDEGAWKRLERKIAGSIKVLTFPKEVSAECTDTDKNALIVISNVASGGIVVKKYNNFLDMCIEGQIIGILWVLTIGVRIDRTLIKECYGNRLNENIEINNGEITSTPSLFKPYYDQYVSWRDEALQISEKMMNQNQSIMITMLDLSRYFYNVNLDENEYEKLTAPFVKDDAEKKLNGLVYSIIKKYSSILSDEKVMLPIGFLPANILSNSYLNLYDRKVKGLDSVIYYGRYVDDILLVTTIDSEATLKEGISNNGINWVTEYMLKHLVNAEVLEDRGDVFGLMGYPSLTIQRDKFRFFYMNGEGSDELIRRIRTDIAKNTSEFNFVPELYHEKVADSEVLKLDRDDTVNKIRAVKNTSIDKYSLSKLLGKKLLMSKLETDEAADSFIEEMDKLLDYRELVANYTLWESLLNYCVVHCRLDKVELFSSKLIKALDDMDECTGRTGDFAYLNRNGVTSVRDSLIVFFHGCFCRALSLLWGKDTLDTISRIATDFNTAFTNQSSFSVDEIIKYRKYYCLSYMVNRSQLPVSMKSIIEETKEFDDANEQRLFSLEDYLVRPYLLQTRKSKYKYMPYIDTPFDVMMRYVLQSLKNKDTVLPRDELLLTEMKKEYASNIGTKREVFKSLVRSRSWTAGTNQCTSIKSQKGLDLQNMKVGVANVRMNEEELISNLEKAHPNREKRCTEIASIVNEAIRCRVNLLVMPEAYVPIEYLQILQKKAAMKNMMIVCGIEHVRIGNTVYNLTASLIPLITDDYRYTVPLFHQKVYYSPDEEKKLKEKGYICAKGDTFSIYSWNGVQIAPYCCFELTSIVDRSRFLGLADVVLGIEWNKDTAYFGNIMEALSRDLYCYCIQSNMSEYGDSRIIQPTKSVFKDILRVKGGENASLLVGSIDITKIRDIRLGKCDEIFKSPPAGWKSWSDS